MLQHPPAVRAGYEEAATTFLGALHDVQEHQWDSPGALGEWTVRALVAHMLRSFTMVEACLAAEPTVDRVLPEAVDYYQVALSDPGLHALVARRARDGAVALTDPIGESEATAQRVLALVASTDDDEPVNTFVGQISLSECLATRAVELGVHTLDLQRATGQPTSMHPATSAVVLSVLTQLTDPARLVLALTGREPLPADFNVLG